MLFGERVRFLREQNNLSQVEIHNRTGLPTKYLFKIECSRAVPSLEVIRKIASALGTSVAELHRGVEETPTKAPSDSSNAVRTLTQPNNHLRHREILSRLVPRNQEKDRRVLVGLTREMNGDVGHSRPEERPSNSCKEDQ